jgi:exonuclease SbcC
MKIKYGLIENFGIIDHTELELQDSQFVVISARNGIGKSTIFNAFKTCIYDDYDGTLKDWIRWGQDSFLIRFVVEHEGIEFDSVLKYSDKETQRILIVKDGNKKESYTMSSKVKEILNQYFPKAISVASSFILQEGNTLVTIQPSERNEYLKKILEVEFTKEVKKLEKQRQEKLDQSKGMKALIDSLESKRYELKELQKLPFEEKEYEDKLAKISDLEKEILLHEANLKIYHQEQNDLNRLITNSVEIKNSIETIEREININELNVKELNIQLNNVDIEINKKISELQSEYSQIISNLDKEKEEIQKKIDSISFSRVGKFDNEELNKKNSQAFSITTEIEKYVKVLSIKSAECPMCHQPLTEKHKQSYKEKVDQLEKELSSVEKEIQELKLKENQHEEKIQEVERAKLEKNELQKMLSNKEHAYDLNIEKRDSKLQELESTKKSKKEMLKQEIDFRKKSTKDLDKSLQDNKLALSKVEEEVRNFKFTFKEQPTIKTTVEEDIKKLKKEVEAYLSIFQNNKEIEAVNKEIESSEKKDKKELKKLIKEYEALLHEDQVFEESIKLVKKDFPLFIINSRKQIMERDANKFLSKVYPRYQLQLKQIKNGLRIVYGPEEADVRTSASGAEKNIFNFAFLHAFSQQGGTGALFLDEVDHFVDEENSEAFFAALGEFKNDYEQVFIISHKKSVRDKLKNEFNADVIKLHRENIYG